MGATDTTGRPAPPGGQELPLAHILWINAGLSCDGDSVSLTAAMQPSIEQIVTGELPGIPPLAVHWPLIDFECGPVQGADNFVEWFFKAERGELEPFVLVVEGSIPNEKTKEEGLLVRPRRRPRHRPAHHHQRVARPARPQGDRRRRHRHLRHGRRHPRHGGQPDRRDGRARLPRLGLDVQGRPADRLPARLPGCPAARLPERRRHLHRLHHARLPRQVHAVHGRAAGGKVSSIASTAYGVDIRAQRAAPGEVVIVSGDIGVHGVAVMSVREGLEFGVAVESDCAALGGLVETMLAVTPDLHALRDPTRGGLVAALNEIAVAAGVGVVLQERSIPVPPEPAVALGAVVQLPPSVEVWIWYAFACAVSHARRTPQTVVAEPRSTCSHRGSPKVLDQRVPGCQGRRPGWSWRLGRSGWTAWPVRAPA